MGNYVEKNKTSHWERLRKYKGKRIPEFFYGIGIPQGWVVGELPDDLKKNIKAEVIPLVPGGRNPLKVLKAKQILEERKSKYCEEFDEIIVLSVPDRESFSQYTTRGVLLSDLTRNSEEVLQEAYYAADEGDLTLCDMKRCAYMAISGKGESDLGILNSNGH